MKKLVYSIFILLLGFSQLTAQIDTFTFTTTFYFEDAVGNRDSVKWSGWPQGDIYNPDQTYGESVSDQPFDPVFEVRAFSSSEYDPSPPYVDAINTYKHFVSPWYPNPDTANCIYHEFYGGAPRFAIKATNYPVVITWDDGLFHPDTGLFNCWLGTILIDNTTPLTFQYWWLESEFNHQFACMSYENSFVIHHDEDAMYFTNSFFGTRGYFPVAGQEHIIDTTQAVIFEVYSEFGAPFCPQTTVNVNETDSQTTGSFLQPSPNPVQGVLQLSYANQEWLPAGELLVFSVTGQVLHRQILTANEKVRIDVRDWPTGYYGITFREKNNGRLQSGKFMKY